MFREIGMLAFALVTCSSAARTGRAEVVAYATGFEQPTFGVGHVSGQDGWTETILQGGSPAFDVVTDSPRSGTQSLRVDGTHFGTNLALDSYGLLHRSIPSVPTGLPADPSVGVVRCEVSLRIDPSSVDTRDVGVYFGGPGTGVRLYLQWYGGGCYANCGIGGAGFPLTVVSVGSWVDLSAEWDRSSHRASLRVSGVDVPALGSGYTNLAGFSGMTIDGSMTGPDFVSIPFAAEFDNISVGLVPTPATATTLLLGVMSCARRRRA